MIGNDCEVCNIYIYYDIYKLKIYSLIILGSGSCCVIIIIIMVNYDTNKLTYSFTSHTPQSLRIDNIHVTCIIIYGNANELISKICVNLVNAKT